MSTTVSLGKALSPDSPTRTDNLRSTSTWSLLLEACSLSSTFCILTTTLEGVPCGNWTSIPPPSSLPSTEPWRPEDFLRSAELSQAAIPISEQMPSTLLSTGTISTTRSSTSACALPVYTRPPSTTSSTKDSLRYRPFSQFVQLHHERKLTDWLCVSIGNLDSCGYRWWCSQQRRDSGLQRRHQSHKRGRRCFLCIRVLRQWYQRLWASWCRREEHLRRWRKQWRCKHPCLAFFFPLH